MTKEELKAARDAAKSFQYIANLARDYAPILANAHRMTRHTLPGIMAFQSQNRMIAHAIAAAQAPSFTMPQIQARPAKCTLPHVGVDEHVTGPPDADFGFRKKRW